MFWCLCPWLRFQQIPISSNIPDFEIQHQVVSFWFWTRFTSPLLKSPTFGQFVVVGLCLLQMVWYVFGTKVWYQIKVCKEKWTTNAMLCWSWLDDIPCSDVLWAKASHKSAATNISASLYTYLTQESLKVFEQKAYNAEGPHESRWQPNIHVVLASKEFPSSRNPNCSFRWYAKLQLLGSSSQVHIEASKHLLLGQVQYQYLLYHQTSSCRKNKSAGVPRRPTWCWCHEWQWRRCCSWQLLHFTKAKTETSHPKA